MVGSYRLRALFIHSALLKLLKLVTVYRFVLLCNFQVVMHDLAVLPKLSEVQSALQPQAEVQFVQAVQAVPTATSSSSYSILYHRGYNSPTPPSPMTYTLSPVNGSDLVSCIFILRN